MAQKCFRAKGDDTCPYHPTEKVVLQCKLCPGSLVCLSCVTSTHTGHQFVKLNERIEEKVDTIRQFVITTETQTIPQLVQEIQSITQKMKEVAEQYKVEIEDIQKQAEQMKHVLDLLMATDVFKLKSLMIDDLTSLEVHRQYLEQLQLKLEDETKENKSTIQSGNAIVVLDTEADIVQRSDVVVPPSPDISVPHFVSCRNPEPHIVKGFGELKTKTVQPRIEVLEGDAEVQLKKQTSPSPIKRTGAAHTQQTDRGKTSINVPLKDKILEKPVMLSHFKTQGLMASIYSSSNYMTWVYGEDVNQVQKINERGEVKQTLDIGERINGICLHPITGDLFYVNYEDRLIRRINTYTEQSTVVFRADDIPQVIACTSDTVIIVYFNGKVCMYTHQGQLVASYKMTYFYDTVYDISVSNQTNRIALACGYGGVIVLDNTLQEVHIYKKEGRYNIEAHSAVFDDSGRLLVSDCNNKTVHILNGSSFQHITTLQTDEMSGAYSLVTQHGMVWIGCCAICNRSIVCLKCID